MRRTISLENSKTRVQASCYSHEVSALSREGRFSVDRRAEPATQIDARSSGDFTVGLRMPIRHLGSDWKAERIGLGCSNDSGVADEVMLDSQIQERIKPRRCRSWKTKLHARASRQALKLLIRDGLREQRIAVLVIRIDPDFAVGQSANGTQTNNRRVEKVSRLPGRY